MYLIVFDVFDVLWNRNTIEYDEPLSKPEAAMIGMESGLLMARVHEPGVHVVSKNSTL